MYSMFCLLLFREKAVSLLMKTIRVNSSTSMFEVPMICCNSEYRSYIDSSQNGLN